ncbi:hypothetical protein OKA04_16390 [Luteolibacter flavescens]|uniref:Uncharacterized protein n=1 Tax=Luteolibacter flavescens TaxID=1859460 RepID=A0ABT3FRV3_9BACT|nr:hypothetical protein [Luteolibacter flavescens]
MKWATAVASYEVEGKEVAQAIDGLFSEGNGWSVDGGELSEQTAIFSVVQPLDAGELQIQLSCAAAEARLRPIRFEVSVTKDISPKPDGQWTPLLPWKVLGVDAETFGNLVTVDQTVATVAMRAPAPPLHASGYTARIPESACFLRTRAVRFTPISSAIAILLRHIMNAPSALDVCTDSNISVICSRLSRGFVVGHAKG